MSSDDELSEGWVHTDEEDIQESLEKELKNDDHEYSPKRIKLEMEDPVVEEEERNFNDNIYSGTPDSYSKTYKQFGQLNTSSSISNCDMSKFKNYLNKNPKLVSVPKVTDADITSDDEIWTVQCPHNFDISKLVGLPILSNEKKKIRIPNSNYECVSFDRNLNSKISILTPNDSNTINVHHTKGRFVVREKLGKTCNIDVEQKPVDNVPFPSNLKIRHPLFGIDYKEFIELPDSVHEKLKNIAKKKLKIKTEKKTIGYEEEESCSNVNDKKSSKKRKMSDSFDSIESNIPNKKIKKEINVWETETSIAECLFEIPMKNKKNVNKL